MSLQIIKYFIRLNLNHGEFPQFVPGLQTKFFIEIELRRLF